MRFFMFLVYKTSILKGLRSGSHKTSLDTFTPPKICHWTVRKSAESKMS